MTPIRAPMEDIGERFEPAEEGGVKWMEDWVGGALLLSLDGSVSVQ